jgi:DNA-binding response OmpR family regulator
MTRLAYDSAETLIYDPVSANRAATRAALYNIGFRHFEVASSIEAFEDSIKRRPPDLAVCEAQGAEDELCASIQNLRQGTSGYNPFIVIVVTAWENSNSLVSRVINSGADDLILRPFSTAVLGQRIRTHIEKRKGFVVTSEYVGPDRRRDPKREDGSAELFNPPNSLKLKALERLSAEEITARLDAELRVARDRLTAEKLRRDAFQVCVLWRLMQAHVPGTAKFDVDLSKLRNITKSVARRCLGTEVESAVDWCESILAAIEGLEAGVDRNASMHLLGHAALNLHQVFAPEKSTSDHLAEIDATVAMVNARTQTAIAS